LRSPIPSAPRAAVNVEGIGIMDRLGWEWEALFDVRARTELERDWLMEPVRARAGWLLYRTRTIKAGPVTECEVYPVYGREQERRARKARENISPERMQRANHQAAIRRIIRLANANFTSQDLHVTLTYDGCVPNWEQCQKDVRNFIRRMQYLRGKRGLEKARYIYTIEDNESGQKKRIHCHMLVSGGISREEIEACWRKGWANADRLQPNEEGLAAIAKYITKAQKNRKKWCCSKGLKQPKVSVSNTRLSRRKVERLASDLEHEWRDVLRTAYPGTEPVSCDVWTSDMMPGVFIRCQMINLSGTAAPSPQSGEIGKAAKPL